MASTSEVQLSTVSVVVGFSAIFFVRVRCYCVVRVGCSEKVREITFDVDIFLSCFLPVVWNSEFSWLEVHILGL